MVTNTDATLYHRIRGNDGDNWQRVYLEEVWWYENIISTVTTNGLKVANGTTNVLTVRIPDTTVMVEKGDYIVKGNCDMEIDTVKDLPTASSHCITGVNYNTFGMNPHVKVVSV